MTKIKSKHLPFKEIKKIINMKGRDLLWRYTLKALPKIYNKPCQQCGENETSEHIFFNFKAHIKNTQEIFNHILTKTNYTRTDQTQRATWERTQSIISKTLRIKSKQRSEEQNKLDSLISQKLLQFSRQ
ncbi:hypothetical protein ACTFIZ_011912 [Dictyostelium cf. discoideum]